MGTLLHTLPRPPQSLQFLFALSIAFLSDKSSVELLAADGLNPNMVV